MLKKLLGTFSKKNPEQISAPTHGGSSSELSASTASERADLAVRMVKELDGASLDYSVASLGAIDRLLLSFHNGGNTSDSMSGTAIVLGCYVGEVIARNLNGKWINSSETPAAHMIQGNIPLVLSGSGYISNPIGKVFKAIDNGSEDSVVWFYEVAKNNT